MERLGFLGVRVGERVLGLPPDIRVDKEKSFIQRASDWRELGDLLWVQEECLWTVTR